MIADDEPSFARILAKVLARDPNIQVVGVAGTPDQAVAAVQRVNPDVALVDVRMPDGGGMRAAAEIKAIAPRTCVVALSAFSDRETVLDMLKAGADGYIVKGTSAEEILRGVQRAVEGEAPLSGTLSRGVLGELQRHLQHQDRARGRHLEVRERIQRALAGDGFEMVFQPMANLANSTLIGVEALARFKGPPSQGPDAWFRDASSVGMRFELEIEAVRRALAAVARLPERAFVSINVSPGLAASSELAEAFPDSLAPHVVLELVDHREVADYDSLAGPLRELRARGVRLAVDDSGEGVASMQRIASLAPDFIKLNRALTRNVDTDLVRRALATAIVTFASQVGAAVIAEGIERPEELTALRDLGVRYGQGFLIGRPSPAAEHDMPFAASMDVPGASDSPQHKEAVPRFNTFLEGVRISLATLTASMPESAILISHIDHETHLVRLLDAAGPADLGLESGRAFPLDASACYLMASGRGPRICGDVPSENAYATVPLLAEAGALSFAGAPIELADGKRVGTVSAFSSRPDAFGPADLDLLGVLAAALVTALEKHEPGDPQLLDGRLRHYAGMDWLTGTLNRHGFAEALDLQWRRAAHRSSWVLAAQVSHLDTVNERYGHTMADLVLKDMVSAMEVEESDGRLVGRIGPGRLAVLLPACEREPAAQRVRAEFAARITKRLARRGVRASVTAGIAPLLPGQEAAHALRVAAECDELVA